MKIAISVEGTGPNARLDPRFGRAKVFLIHDLDSGASVTVDNGQNLEAAQGAGIQAAQTVAATGAKALISGHVGPKAFTALKAAGIDIFLFKNASAQEAIAAYKAGSLERQENADVEGHW
jgi:predicted Fe-Mo cluster-binding NifX family protein